MNVIDPYYESFNATGIMAFLDAIYLSDPYFGYITRAMINLRKM